MKKILFTGISILVTFTTLAQTMRWNLGIEGGTGRANIIGKNLIKENYNNKVGYSAGLNVQYHFSKTLSLRSGISYERKGNKENSVFHNALIVAGNPPADLQIPYLTTYDYLSVPLLLRATVGKKIKYFTNAGLNFSYLLDKYDERLDGGQHGTNLHFRQIYKSFDLGFIAGAGVLYPINERIGFILELRHNQGLLNFNEGFRERDEPMYHSVTNLQAGLQFSLKVKKS